MHILCWISYSLILTVTDINERRWWSKWYRAEFQLVKCITELHSVSSKWISYIVYELLKIEHHKSVHIRNRGRIKFNSQNEVGYHMNREAIHGHHSIRPFRWNIRAFMTNENSMQMEFKVFGEVCVCRRCSIYKQVVNIAKWMVLSVHRSKKIWRTTLLKCLNVLNSNFIILTNTVKTESGTLSMKRNHLYCVWVWMDGWIEVGISTIGSVESHRN